MSAKQVELILQYIRENPGCVMREVIRDTEQPKSSVASVLSRAAASGQLRRDGSEGRYRYYIGTDEEKTSDQSLQRKSSQSRTANPLTTLFNERLASVRSGRASA